MPPENEYTECPNCCCTIRAEVEGDEVRFCYLCGAELELASILNNGLEDSESE